MSQQPLALPAGMGVGLTALAGYVDTLGFIALFGLFTAHVTGNFVLIGKELAEPGWSILMKMLAFLAFMLAVAWARLWSRRLERQQRSEVAALLTLQAVLLLVFMVAGLMIPNGAREVPASFVAAIAGAAAMGLQNAQGRMQLASLVPMTVMTGNVTQLVIDLVDGCSTHAEAASARARARRFLPPILGFAGGAMAGALAYRQVSYWGLALPTAYLVWCAYRVRRAHLLRGV